ncbi:MAG TPA: lysophospholipid acyltransferase family protein [Ohtaekwangia sp.]|nr:lysophospholipid acyltransferase family protein [Ohtaekwangia sp.]
MIFLRLISWLPLGALYLLADFLFVVVYYIIRYRRQLVRKNLETSFPGKSRRELIQIEKEFYINLCDYAVETLKLLTMTETFLSQRMVFRNQEIIQHYKDEQTPVLMLAAHQFNWEWLLAAGNFSLPVPIDFVYQPLHLSFFNAFLLKCRTRFGAYPIKRDDVAREVIRRKGILRGVAIIADQYPGLKRDKKFPLHFMGQETVFFQGANQLALLTQYPVVFAGVKKIKRGYYEATFIKIAEPPYPKGDVSIIKTYAAEVEKLIRENPAGWLWTHRRWKRRHIKGIKY